VIGTLAAVAALPVLGYGGQRWAESRDRRRFQAPGRIVEVDGAQLHVVVEGSGPVVLIDSGLGGCHSEWEGVAAALRGDLTVIRYDRPGLGWSPLGGADRSPLATARGMKALLETLDVTEPVVLVGHSLGGLHVRLFASLFPELTRGLVLVDPSHEDMLDGDVPRAAKVVEGGLRALAAAAPFGVARVGGRLWSKTVAAQLRVPLDEVSRATVRQSTLLTACSVTGLRAVAAELSALPASLREVKELTAAHPVPPVPLTVITASAEPRTPAERTARDTIGELHRKQAMASPLGRQVLATASGHLVPLDEPLLVAACVRETLVAAETGAWS